jgi:hypothetical protein
LVLNNLPFPALQTCTQKYCNFFHFAAAGSERDSKWPRTRGSLRLVTKDIKFSSRLCSYILYNNRVRNCRQERTCYGNMQAFDSCKFVLAWLSIPHTHALRTSKRRINISDHGGRAFKGLSLRPLDSWDVVFISCWRHGCWFVCVCVCECVSVCVCVCLNAYDLET